MTSSEAVGIIRTTLGLTQHTLARRLGVRVATVNRWERGLAEPSRLAWLALRGLGVPGVDAHVAAMLEQRRGAR